MTKSSLHVFGFGDDAVWITLLEPSHDLRIQEMNSVKLVSKSYPRSGGGRKGQLVHVKYVEQLLGL